MGDVCTGLCLVLQGGLSVVSGWEFGRKRVPEVVVFSKDEPASVQLSGVGVFLKHERFSYCTHVVSDGGDNSSYFPLSSFPKTCLSISSLSPFSQNMPGFPISLFLLLLFFSEVYMLYLQLLPPGK